MESEMKIGPYSVKERLGYGRTELLTVCIGHRDPLFVLPEDALILEFGQPGRISRNRFKEVLNIEKEHPYISLFRPELTVFLGLYALQRHLSSNFSDLDFSLNISTYRTFIIPKKLRDHKESMNMNFIKPIQVEEFREFTTCSHIDQKWLVPFPTPTSGVHKVYFSKFPEKSKYYDQFLMCAVDEGVIDIEQAFACKYNHTHLTALGVGVIPAQQFCSVFEKVSRVADRFFVDYVREGSPEENFQVIALPFDRLALFLMELEIRDQFGIIPQNLFGYWTHVSDELKYTPGRLV